MSMSMRMRMRWTMWVPNHWCASIAMGIIIPRPGLKSLPRYHQLRVEQLIPKLWIGCSSDPGMPLYASARCSNLLMAVPRRCSSCKLQAMVVRHGVFLAGIGVVIGLVGAAAVTRIMASFLARDHPLMRRSAATASSTRS